LFASLWWGAARPSEEAFANVAGYKPLARLNDGISRIVDLLDLLTAVELKSKQLPMQP